MATFTTAAFDMLLTALLLSSGLRQINNLSFHTGDPGADGTANELTGTGYTRKNISFNAATGASTNLVTWTNTGTTAWDTITHVGLRNGNYNFYHGCIALEIGKEVPAGETLAIGIGDLVVSVPSGLCLEGRKQLLTAITYGSSDFRRMLRLHTGDPGDNGINNLFALPTGYAAVNLTFGAAVGGVASNITEPIFVNNGTVAWPTATHWSLGANSTSSGYAKGALATPLTLQPGKMATFVAGSIQIKLENV